MGEESKVLDNTNVDDDVKMEDNDNKEIIELSQEQKELLAEKTKEDGNAAYKLKKYDLALECYSKAISLCPNSSSYYSNRAAVLMMLQKYSDALNDARQSIQIDPNFVKGYIRAAKCQICLGEAAAAINHLEHANNLEKNNSQISTDLKIAQNLQNYLCIAEKTFSQKDFRKVVYLMDRCIEISPACIKFKSTKAECLVLLKRYDEAQNLSFELLRKDSFNADAIYARGLCLYYQDCVDKALNHFQQVLRLAPDHTKAKTVYKKAKNLITKKEEGNNAFKSREWQKAYELYSSALSIDPFNVFTNSKLFCNRAAVLSKLKKYEEAIIDCNNALELDSKYMKAYLRRAKCYMDQEKFEDAIREYNLILKMDSTRENKQLLKEAQLELKKSKRKDYYKLLGVSKNANDDELKKAYKKRALLHHPDRHSSADEEAKKEEEIKFKDIGEAYAVLSDSKKRCRYDNGEDLEDMEGPDLHNFDANSFFHSFFTPHSRGFPFNSGGNNFSFHYT